MFEVSVFTPAQFGAFVAWLVINRGPLGALVHPNTDDTEVGASSFHIFLDFSWWDIAGKVIAERPYPTSDVIGKQILIGLEYFQADERS